MNKFFYVLSFCTFPFHLLLIFFAFSPGQKDHWHSDKLRGIRRVIGRWRHRKLLLAVEFDLPSQSPRASNAIFCKSRARKKNETRECLELGANAVMNSTYFQLPFVSQQSECSMLSMFPFKIHDGKEIVSICLSRGVVMERHRRRAPATTSARV